MILWKTNAPRCTLRTGAHGLLAAVLAMALAAVATVAAARDTVEITLRMDGLNRTATLYLPDNPSAQARWPLVVALHPGWATGESMAEMSRLHRQPGSENFAVVYPDGFRRSWNAGECCGRAQARNLDDVGFILRMIDEVNRVIPVQDRVFVAGYSNGALLAYRLACEAPERLAAFSVYAGAPVLNDATCSPSRSVPLLHLHGELDAVAPLDGGRSAIGSAGTRVSVLDNIRWWSEMNRCSERSASSFVRNADCTAYRSCRGGSETLFCVFPGQGHYWPGHPGTRFGDRQGLGPARTDLNGGAPMIRFFERHR